MLRAVLFDLDNTLIDRDRAFRACVTARFPDPEVHRELFHLDACGHGARDALFAAWDRHAGSPLTQESLVERIAASLAPEQSLLRVLRELAARVEIGVITNGGGAAQRRKLSAAGLDQVFPRHRIWVSAELGMAKPDPAIFLCACDSLGIPPERCLYIGDHAPHDRVGPARIGMRSQLVDAALTGERLQTLLQQEGLA